jgi:hypothetical protein
MHHVVQPAVFRDQLGPRPLGQVVGVRKNDLAAGLHHMVRRQRTNGALCAHGHEDRSLHGSMGQREGTGTRCATALVELEWNEIHGRATSERGTGSITTKNGRPMRLVALPAQAASPTMRFLRSLRVQYIESPFCFLPRSLTATFPSPAPFPVQRHASRANNHKFGAPRPTTCSGTRSGT